MDVCDKVLMTFYLGKLKDFASFSANAVWQKINQNESYLR